MLSSNPTVRFIAENLPHIVWIAEADGSISFFNSAYYELTGLSPSSSREEHLRAVHPEDREFAGRLWQDSLAHNKPFECELRYVTRHGAARWFLCRAMPHDAENGRGQQWFGTATDIHDQKLLVYERNLAIQQAEAAAEIKNRFLALMSHELRTPLTSIMGYTELLEAGLAGALSTQAMTYLSRSRSAANQLKERIDDILRLSRTDDISGELQVSPVDMVRVACDVVDTMRPRAHEKGLAIRCEAASNDTTVTSDPSKLRRILLNLVDNAIKFTPAGEVKVVVSKENDCVIADVKDTGVGIPAEETGAIFEPFRDSPRTMPNGAQCMGIGLTTSARLARALKGEIAVKESVPGFGSTFRLKVPLR